MKSLLYVGRARHCLLHNFRPAYKGRSKDCFALWTRSTRYSQVSTPDSRTTRAVRTRRPFIRTCDKGDSWTNYPNKSRSEKINVERDVRLRCIQNWSDQGKALYTDIVSGMVQSTRHVQTCISEGDLTVETIHVCLRAELIRLFQLQREQRIEKLRNWDGPLARLILVHIWKDIKMWNPLITEDNEASFMLCLLAVNEGLDQYIIDWLKTANSSLDASQPRYYLVWRNSLFRSLVAAHMNIDSKGCADAAIKCFWTVADAVKEQASEREVLFTDDGFQCISVRPALQYMITELLSGRFDNTDSELYEGVWRMYNTYGKRAYDTLEDKKSYAFCLAGSNLFHPKDPSCDRAVNFLRKQVDSVGPEKLREFLHLKDRGVWVYLRRAIELAQRKGRQEDVRFLEKLLEDWNLKNEEFRLPERAVRFVDATKSRPTSRKRKVE